MQGDLIFLHTVNHTGTWFALDLLQTFEGVTGFTTLGMLPYTLQGRGRQHRVGEMVQGNEVAGDGRMVVQAHVHTYPRHQLGTGFGNIELTLALSLACPTIVTLRDPLLTLMTRQKRLSSHHPHRDLIAQWTNFVESMELFEEFIKPIYLSVDLLSECADKFLKDCEAQGLVPTDATLLMLQEGLPRNSAGESVYDEAYRSGDWKAFTDGMTAETYLLEDNKYLLKPFLKAHGYKDLLWW